MGNCLYDNFYEMFKENLIKDHYTPGIKAEVIWDTILTPYIPGLISNKQKEKDSNLKLIAKEFPVRTNNSDLRNAKIDYLVEGDKYLYIVELKTTNSSFEEKQYNRYKSIMGDRDDFWDFYKMIIDKNVKEAYFDGYEDRFSDDDFLVHIKYVEQVKTVTGYTRLNDKDELMSVLSKCIDERLKLKELKLVYVSIYNIDELVDSEVIKISLKDEAETYNNNDVWRQVLDIVDEVIKRDKDYGTNH